ncbi:HNH endonuclease [Paenibacillus sp. alder61]|uniref:ABC-three component system protein n=1 Tax=Paenibacillus sp. alder61 TaxID=2862948 RepID=UPI001CD6BD58|nr:ABC-three component system protein [Paenibacillus sp. alder61]MCA1291905.1 HNH endonuclease [Paenibacillus sp. alder61]
MKVKDNRKALTDNENLKLFSEVEGYCPLCAKSLLYKKGNKLHRIFEGAHIYPLNPTSEERELLKNEEKLSDDVNAIENYIALCRDCHWKFDKPRTVEEYRRLVAIKKQLIIRDENRSRYFSYQIESEINTILNLLANEDDWEFDPDKLSMDALKIEEKVDSTLKKTTKRRIIADVNDYYLYIQEQFSQLDKSNPDTFETIATQIKALYKTLKKSGQNQEDIYQYMSEWLSKKTERSPVEVCKIIISFFVQNCEVFS